MSNLVPIVQDEISQETVTRITNDTQLQKVPRRSGSVVRQPKKIHVLGEFLDSIPGGHEPDLRSYDEVLQDKDAASWQRVMNKKIRIYVF